MAALSPGPPPSTPRVFNMGMGLGMRLPVLCMYVCMHAYMYVLMSIIIIKLFQCCMHDAMMELHRELDQITRHKTPQIKLVYKNYHQKT